MRPELDLLPAQGCWWGCGAALCWAGAAALSQRTRQGEPAATVNMSASMGPPTRDGGCQTEAADLLSLLSGK